jgi:glucose-6-phosphate isomerase
MLQLWREGPPDKVIGFLDVATSEDISLGKNALGESHSWLSGQSLQGLLQAEMRATQHAVHEAGQSTWTLSFPELNSFYIGQFIALWQDTVAIAGRLMNINPYDQPGVEFGKRLTKDSFM